MPNQKNGIFKHPVVITFLAIIALIEFIRMSLFLVFLQSFLNTLKYSTVAIGAVISANLLADNISKSAVGWMVDHKGPWPILFAGSIMTLAGILLIITLHENFLFLI